MPYCIKEQSQREIEAQKFCVVGLPLQGCVPFVKCYALIEIGL